MLGSISQDFTKDEQSENSLNGSSIKKGNYFNIHQNVMIKNNIKRSLDLLCNRAL